MTEKLKQLWCSFRTGHTGTLDESGRYFGCDLCGKKYFVWFTDNVFWNEVMENDEGKGMLLCPDCFVKRAEDKFKVTGWRLLPEFKWQENV